MIDPDLSWTPTRKEQPAMIEIEGIVPIAQNSIRTWPWYPYEAIMGIIGLRGQGRLRLSRRNDEGLRNRLRRLASGQDPVQDTGDLMMRGDETFTTTRIGLKALL